MNCVHWDVKASRQLTLILEKEYWDIFICHQLMFPFLMLLLKMLCSKVARLNGQVSLLKENNLYIFEALHSLGFCWVCFMLLATKYILTNVFGFWHSSIWILKPYCHIHSHVILSWLELICCSRLIWV